MCLKDVQPVSLSRRLSGKLALLFVLCCLAVAGITACSAYQGKNSQARTEASTTATALSYARTITAQASTTEAAIVPLAAANPLPSYLSADGILALYDPLNQPGMGGWPVNTNPAFGGACQYTGGTYTISETSAQRFYQCATSHTFSDFTFEVHMAIVQGDCGGIDFREDGTGSKYYKFSICQDGSYDLSLYQSHNGADAQSLGDGLVVQGLKRTNTVAVVADGSDILLYVNEKLVNEIQDDTYSSGSLGLIAGSYGSKTEVSYTDARVWT